MVIVPVLDLAGLADYANKTRQSFMSDNPVMFLYFLQIDSNGYVSNVYQPTEGGSEARFHYSQRRDSEIMPEDEGLEELSRQDLFKVLSEEEIDAIRYKPLWGACYDFEEDRECTCLVGDIQLDTLASLDDDPKYKGPIKYYLSSYVTVIPRSGNKRIDVSETVGELTAGVFMGLLYENGAFQGDTLEEIKRNLDFLTNF